MGTDPKVAAAVGSITPEDVIRRIGVMAHDSMRGRNTPSPELNEVAAWIGSEFQRMGLQPGGDNGSFLQRYTVERIRIDQTQSGVHIADGPTWRVGTELLRHFGGPAPNGVSGSAVLITGSEDLSSLANANLKNAIALVAVSSLNAAQGIVGPVMEQGPAAVLLVTDSDIRPDGRWNQLLNEQARANLVPSWTSGGIPLLEIRANTLAPVLEGHNVDLAAIKRESTDRVTAQPVPDLQVTVTLTPEVLESIQAPNTVGILEGSDPVLKNEFIVFSAHMDHVGVGRPVDGDSIHNGADDDASGTAGIMELAEAFSMLNPRPKRSLVFVTVSGEEKGLWGSDYFAANSPMPSENVVANLNADMIGRNWPDTIVVIGKEHSDLGETLNRVNTAHPELNMTAIDDLWPDERFYFRSDHFNFAKRGVPILFFFNGVHDDYHRPSDEVDAIDAEKESRIVKLMFYLGLEVANADERPKWDLESYKRIVEMGRN